MIDFFYTPPANLILSAVLLTTALVCLAQSIRRFMSACQQAETYRSSILFIRGIRNLLISLTASVWSASFFFNIRWLFIIGLIIICQEIYEGSVLSALLKRGDRLEEK